MNITSVGEKKLYGKVVPFVPFIPLVEHTPERDATQPKSPETEQHNTMKAKRNRLASLPCPTCGSRSSDVLRTNTVGAVIRRQRRCLICQRRFTTKETATGSSFDVQSLINAMNLTPKKPTLH